MWVSTIFASIVKVSLSFTNKFWWAIVRSLIQLTHTDNIVTPDHAVLVASILGRYDIDWTHLIVEQIHEASLKNSTSIFFPCLICHLCIAEAVEINHHLDTLIEVQRILDASLIKANDNLVALW